jgi:hypothetical protein
MKKTSLLPPISAVKLLWGATRAFANDAIDDAYEVIVKPQLDSLAQLAGDNKEEKLYLKYAGIQLMASLRNAGMIYKGRQLNYAENRALRKAFLESLKERYEFSMQIKEIINNLPAVSFTGIGGLALLHAITAEPELLVQFFIAVLFGFLGYFIRRGVLKRSQSRKHLNYIRQDYEATIYFFDYLDRMELVLVRLYENLEEIHKQLFTEYYNSEDSYKEAIKNLLRESLPNRCKYIDEHIRERKIKPDLWHMCETSLLARDNCRHYPKTEPVVEGS